MRRGIVLMTLIVSLSPALGGAVTRLGLHVTSEELAVWQQRATDGPYRVAGDVQTNSPGDWTRILNNANTFKTDMQDGVYVDRRVGQPTDSCVQTNSALDIAGKRGIGDALRDAAFVYLVTGDTSYRTPVLTELLAQAAVPGTNMGNSSRWCTSVALGDVDPTFDMATWQMKLLLGYDYVQAGDQLYSQSIPSGDKTTLDTWFLNAGLFWQQNISRLIRTRFPNRDSDDYSNPTNCCLDHARVAYFGGPTVLEWHRAWSNRGLNQVRFWAAVGIMQDHAALKASAKRYVKEILKYHTWPDNTVSEFDRWFVPNDTFPTLGFGYAGYLVHGMLGIADHFARNGDTELFDYSTSDGHQGTAGGTKTLRGVIELFQDHVNQMVVRYGTDNAANNGNIDYRIDTIYEPKGWFAIQDVWLAQAVRFYNDATMQSYILRTCSACPGYPSNPAHGGFQPWSGEWGVYPGVLFLFSESSTEGPLKLSDVDPYNLSTDTVAPDPPTGLTVSCAGSPTSCTLSATKATQNTDASAYDDPWGYRIRYCSGSASCVPANGTTVDVAETGNLSNHVISGLTSDTLYRFDIASRDTAGNLSTFTAVEEDTTDTAPPPALIGHWRFLETTGTVAADETVNNHDGTVSGGHTWENPGLTLDGIDGRVRITRTATLEPTQFTLCAHITRNGTQAQFADLVNKTWQNDTSPTFTSYALQLNRGGIGSDIVTFWHGRSGGLEGLNSSAAAIPDGEPVWICGTYDPATTSPQKRLFIQGNADQSGTTTTAVVYDSTSTGDLYFGSNGAGRAAAVTYHEVRLYDGILSDADIAALTQGNPGVTGVFAQGDWAWRWPQQPENGPFQRTTGYTNSPGQIVKGNHARVRLTLSRSLDTSALMAFVPYFRVNGGAWQPLTDSCSTDAFCFGFDTVLAHGLNTTAQLVSANDFNTGGKFYEAFGSRTDRISLAGGKATEYEIVVRAADDTAVGTTIGICLRQEDGTELDSCNEATAVVVAPMAQIWGF